MYFAIVILFLVVCPAVSVVFEAMRLHASPVDPMLIVRWWTFWAGGVRLAVAGIRQVLQPGFTAQQIFGVQDASALPLIREIGFGNLAMGTLGLCSLWQRGWVVPAAIVTGLYYGLAAAGHLPPKNKNAKEYTAMVSDAFACLILLAFAAKCHG